MEESFKKLRALSEKLCEECEWDRKQTVHSYFKYLLEEAEEFHEAAEKGDTDSMKDELGDVMWNLLMIGYMAEKEGLFTLKDAIDNVHEKMVRRHPHIFNGEPNNVDDIKRRWKEIKAEEKKVKENNQ